MTGKEIKILRISRKETQEQFAHAVGITAKTVSRLENGYNEPSKLVINALRGLAQK